MFSAFSLQKDNKGGGWGVGGVLCVVLAKLFIVSVGPVVSHGLSMPSVNRELTQLASNTLQGQLPPPASTTHDHFINSEVSTCTVPVNNAENRIVCHSRSSVLNFDSSAHSRSDSHTETHCNSLTIDKRMTLFPAFLPISLMSQGNIHQIQLQQNCFRILRPMKLTIWLVLFHPSKTSVFLKSQILINLDVSWFLNCML